MGSPVLVFWIARLFVGLFGVAFLNFRTVLKHFRVLVLERDRELNEMISFKL